MKIRICPGCNKIVYAEKKTQLPVCSYCGYAFDERRMLSRAERAVNVFFFRGALQTAKTKNISENGARITYMGKPLEQDTVLQYFNIEGSGAKKSAKVVWSRRAGNRMSESGLRYLSKRR